ncbi:MAG: hypothetical protein ACJ8M1_03935 [Chthoniobacterales bacterium]
MKGVVLTVAGILISSLGAFADTETGTTFTTNYSSTPDPAVMLRAPAARATVSSQFVSDAQSERRSSRPTVAYTVFRINSKYAEVSVQPVFGRINGAQLYLSF